MGFSEWSKKHRETITSNTTTTGGGFSEWSKRQRESTNNTTTESAGAVTLPRREAAIERASGAFDMPQTSGVIKQGKFDALAPMRGTMEAAKPVIEAQKELAAAKAPYGAKEAGTTASGGRRVVYTAPTLAEAKKLGTLEAKADTVQKTFQREILEKAAEGKTAEADHMRQLLQNQRKNLFNINPEYLSAAERAKYNILYERDPGLADTYLDTIAAEVNARGAREESEKIKSFAKEHPVLGTAANVAGSFVTPLSAAEAAISKLRGKESDPNSIWHIGSRLTESTQEGLTGDIKNPFGKFLADTGLSMAQYLSKLPLGGTAALAVMASGAAGQTAYSARQSGADTDEALLLGTIAGVSEAVLEKLPLDNILASFKGGDRAGAVARLTGMIKQPIRDMLGSAVEEGGEEILTEYINTLADVIVRGDRSDMMRYRDELIASGMSAEEATKKANMTYLVTNPLLALAGGALSGGVMAGTAVGSNWAQGKIGTAVQNRIERQNAKKQAAEAAQGDTTVQNKDTAQETQEAATEGEPLADVFEDTTAPETSQTEPENAFTSYLDDEEMDMLPDWAVEEERAARAAADAAAREAESNEMISEVTNPLLTGENPLFTAAEETRRKRAETAKNDTQRTGYLAGATDEDIALAETVSRLYGRRVVFESNNYRLNGRYEDGTIYLNPNSKNVLASTLAHELTHTAEGYKNYNDLMSVVREMNTAEGKNWNELREEVFGRGYAELYKKQGRTFTETDADREIVADAVAQILGSQEKLDSFVKSHHSIAAHWWYKVKSLIGRITGKQPRVQLTDAERMVASYHKQIEAMLGEALRKTKRQSATASGVQYDFVGKTNGGITEQQRARMRELLSSGSLFAPIKYRREIGMSQEEYDSLYEEVKGRPAPKPRTEHKAVTKSNKTNAADVEESQDYRMKHRPDEYGIGYDLTSEGAMPNDFYENPRHYANLNDPATAESYDVLKRIRNKPGADVTIYRAAPVNEFNYGDWVTLSPTYAKRHRDHSGAAELQVYSLKVKAKDISWAGDDINEFGYFPKTEAHTRIRVDMSSEERAEALKNRVISNIPEVHELAQPMQGLSSWDDLNTLRGKDKRNLMQKLAEEFGAFKGYTNEDIDLEFEFTTSNYRESYGKQKRGFIRFAKMFSVFDNVIENAVGIEVHKREDYKPDPTLKNVYVLMSAYGDGENIVPVKLEVKEFADKPNSLYVAIALEAIKKAEVSKKGIYHEGVAHFSRSADISIADLMRKVNPFDVSFTKYFPESMRTEAQTQEIERMRQETGAKYSLSAEEAADQRQDAIRMLQDGADPEKVYEDTGYYIDDNGNIRTDADSPKQQKPSASKAMKTIKAVVADMVDAMTGENHTNAFKRDVLNRIMDQYDAMSDVGSDAEYRRQKEEFREFADELAQEIVDNNRIRNADNERAANDIKAQLRTPIKVSDNAKRDFYGEKGWNAWRKSQMGKLNLTNDKGIGIDTLYMQLSSQYPEYFPESIENEGDMLRKMAEVREIVGGEDFIHDSYYEFSGGDTAARADAERISEMIRRGWEIVKDMPSYDTSRIARSEISRVREGYEKRLERQALEYEAVIREAEEKRLAKEEERKKYNAYRKEMRGESLSLDEIAKWMSDNTFVQEMKKHHAQLKEYQEEAAKYAKVDLSKVKGVETRRYIQKIRDRAEDKKVYIRRVGQARRKVLRQQALEILRSGDIEKWKDKRAGVFHSVGTMIRNITDISGGDELGEKILNKYFEPIAKHVAEATRLKNTMRQRVRELNLSTVPSGNNELSESAFVQLYGEAKDNIYMLENKLGYKNVYNGEATRGGRTLQEWRDVLNQLATDNPDIVNNAETMKKIDNAVEEFKKLYDELMPLINDVRVYNGYEPIAYRHGYFPHFSSQVKADGVFSSLLDGLGISPDLDGLPTTINGLTSRFRPGMQYQAFDKQRTDNPGKEYDGVHLVGMGAVEGFDRYIEVAANVIYLTGDVQKLRALSDSIRYNASDEGIKEQVENIRNNGELDESERETVIENLLKGSKTRLNNFVVELEEYTNLLAGKKSLRDREAEQFLGRQFYRLTKNIESRIAANMVAINPGSWMTNFVPLTQAGAVLKTGSMLGAMGETIKAVQEDDGFVARSSFLTNRLGSERLVKRTSQEIGDVLAQPMQWIDNFTASTIVRARYNENIQKGMSADEAMQEADKFAAAIMGDRSQGAMPTIFAQQNPITKLFTQYQLEVANQLAWMTKDLPRMFKDDKKKLAAALLKLALYGWLYNLVYHAFTGRDAAFDPIGVLNDTVGDFTGYSLPDIGEAASAIFSDKVTWKDIMKTARKKPGEALGNLGTAALEQLPFTAGLGALIPDFDAGRIPISSAMPDLTQLGNIFDPESAWQKKLQSAYKLASPVATYLAPPFGGGQIKKTAESIAAIAQGGSYTYNKEGERQLQYPVYTDNALDVIGKVPMAVFGKSSSSAGRDWIESGFKTQSAKNTKAYENLVKSGVSQREAWAAVNGISGTTIAEKAASLDKMQLDGKAKAQLYYDRVLSENSKARVVMDKIGKTAEAYELLSAFAQFDTTSEKTAALQFSKLGDKEREIVFNELVTSSYADVTDGLAADGISFGDFLKVYQAGLDYEQHGMVKKEATLTAIDSLNLSKAQKDKLYLCFFNESLLKNAPWNTLFRMPELPALEIPDIRIPKLDLPF